MTNTAPAGRRLVLEPTAVPEWDTEDLLFSDLATAAEDVSADEARAKFSEVTLAFPTACLDRDLVAYAQAESTPLGPEIVAAAQQFDFHLMELPVNILVPPRQTLARLQVNLTAEPANGTGTVLSYDIFPKDSFKMVEHDIGSVSVDVSKALMFLGPVGKAVSDVLGLKLSVPIKWDSLSVSVRTTDRLSNPVRWDVVDEAINQGLTTYVIWRAPKGSTVTVKAALLGELRWGLLGRLRKARFRTDDQEYSVPSAPQP